MNRVGVRPAFVSPRTGMSLIRFRTALRVPRTGMNHCNIAIVKPLPRLTVPIPYSIVPIDVSTPRTVDIISGVGFEKVLARWIFPKNNVLADTFCVFNPSAYT